MRSSLFDDCCSLVCQIPSFKEVAIIFYNMKNEIKTTVIENRRDKKKG